MQRLLQSLLLSLCLLLPLLASAQLTKNKFGKNRLQYKVFNWRYYSTNNFDIYFYDDGQQLARHTADFMEEEYDRIADLLGYAPYSKTKVFLYNSIADLQQSNVGVNENNFTIGGQTNFVKSHVEVAFPGTLEEFKEELVYEISHMLIMDMMFGGSLTDIFQNTYLMTLPDWFIEGAARYVAYGWDVEMDDYMRDILREGSIPKLNKLEGYEAGIVGQSVWNYIAEKHGRSSLSNVLNYTRIIRNEETAIANTLGLPFRYFLVEWRGYYTEMAAQAHENYRAPSPENMVGENTKGVGVHNSVAISPNGRYLAFTENFRGRYRIKLKDLENGKVTTIIRKGYRMLDQETDDTVPLVAWQSDESLGIIGVEKGLYTLYLHNIASENTSSQVIGKISQVNDFNFSPNGKVVVFSAEKKGQNDIYLYSISRNSLRAITSDLYDDVHPSFMPGSNHILFSSNRKSDTLNVDDVKLADISSNYNLFIYNIDTTDQVLSRLTNTISKDVRPKADGKGNIYYLSDQKGIFNLFRYNLQDSLIKQVTALNTSIEDFSIDFDRNAMAYVALFDGNEQVFLQQGLDLNINNFTPATQRQNMVQGRYVLRQLRNSTKPIKKDPLTPAPPILPTDSIELNPPDTTVSDKSTEERAVAQAADTTAIQQEGEGQTPESQQQEETRPLNTDNYTFDQEEAPEAAEAEESQEQEDTRPIDTDNYVFDSQQEGQQQAKPSQQESFLSTYRKLRRRNVVQGPMPMEQRFMVNSLVTSWAIDPLRSSIRSNQIGFVLQGQMNDMLENHKVYGGLLAMTDLRSGDLFLEYEFLKYLMDFNVRIDRRVVVQPIDVNYQHKYILNKVEFGASLPLNVSTRISAGPILANSRFLATGINSISNPEDNDKISYYGGGNVEFVYDNTIVKGFNLYNGTMGRIQYQHLAGIDDASMGFGKLSAEAKNYFPISRDFILATRGYVGTFIGPNEPSYVLGGMDNWIINRTDDSGGQRPFQTEPGYDNRNLLFHEFVTPMRGFNYNAQNGKSVLLFNAELRFPLIKYFYRGPISSNFFRNLQAIGFYDIGSAWSGTAPFFRNNSVNTQELNPPGSPFRAVIQNYKNPWLSSFGFGVRTVLLGYYVKLDVAYPIVDYEVKDTRFFLTFGYDF